MVAPTFKRKINVTDTYERLLIQQHSGVCRWLGLGATHDGHLIATWTVGEDRLTIECLPKDIARWHLSVLIDGERERAAANTPLQRLSQVLQPYDPNRWFRHANNIPAA
jgi:hypothetical protein